MPIPAASCLPTPVVALMLTILQAAATAVAPPPATLNGEQFLTFPGDQWRLVWHDEFDGASLDTSKWSIGLPWRGDDGTNRHHNSQYGSVISDDDVVVRGGSLHLFTRRIETPNPRGGTYKYTEGLITSSGKFSQAFGYFEMRAKLPIEAGPGTWPAFWLLTDGWPPEMDILEYWGSQNRIHQGTVTRAADGKQHWDSYHRRNVSMSGWHTYGLEWGPGYQIYNIDRQRTNAIFGGYLPNTPHYVLLNSGIETARPPQAGTTFPNDFTVDWVRVYARPADAAALINGDFESDDPLPWQLTGEASVVDYGAHSGSRCLRLDSTTADMPAVARQTVYGLKPGTKYTVTAYVRAVDAQAQITISGFRGSASLTPPSVTSSLDIRSSNYMPLRVEFTTAADATSAVIDCGSNHAGVVFFDSVAIRSVEK